MASAAKPLRDAIKVQFYPFAADHGFVRQKSINPLFVSFVRSEHAHTDAFDIQWDKHHRPFFRINFRNRNSDEHHYAGSLQRQRGESLRYSWFSLRRPWPSKLSTLRWICTPDEVAFEVIDAFEELESWWGGGGIGPHMNMW